jgi:hypothetical protein
VAEKVVELLIGHVLCKIFDVQRYGHKLAHSAGNDTGQNDSISFFKKNKKKKRKRKRKKKNLTVSYGFAI